MAAPAAVDYQKKAPVNFGVNLMRTSIGQGLAFGFGDEAEAFARSLMSDKSYDELINEVRSEIDTFREQSPYAAYGSEIVGSIPSFMLAGAGLARVGVTGAAKVGGALGTAYGVGVGEGDITTAEGLQNRATSGAISGALGGTISKVASKLLPVKSEVAKKLVDKDIPLTPGQTFRDGPSLGSTLVTALEDLSTSYPGAGHPIQAKRLEALIVANRRLLEEAIEPLKIKIPSTIKTSREAFEYVDDIVSKKYDDVLGKLKLPDTQNLSRRMLDVVEDSVLDSVEQKRVLKILDKYINNKIKNGALDGKTLKNAQTELTRLSTNFSKKGGFEGEIGEVFKSIRTVLDDEINLQNAGALDLAKVKSDRTNRKLKVLTGDAPLQKSVEEMAAVLGQGFPETGTASRLLMQDSINNPLRLAKLIPPGIASEIAMSRMPTMGLTSLPGVGGAFRKLGLGGNPTTGLLSLPEPGLRRSSSAIGANLGALVSNNPTQDYNNN